MERVVLGLDIGGANLKAATSTGRAMSVPFAVWKHPDKLSDELRKLIGQFPETSTIAATMTAELCDCYETKREGVRRIVDDLVAATSLPVRIWSTEGKFVTPKAAKAHHMKVAAANWHALATFAGRFVPKGSAILIDMGTTTTDFIPIINGVPSTRGLTDTERIRHSELAYMGWKRTPATSILGIHNYASEFFATCQDAYIVLKMIQENPQDHDTADGRPATLQNSMARLARMLCGDMDTLSKKRILEIAKDIYRRQHHVIINTIYSLNRTQLINSRTPITYLLSGSGVFLTAAAIRKPDPSVSLLRWKPIREIITLEDRIGGQCSQSGPAYAASILGMES